jgi:predicted RNA binding protein YcfA (HicA-like mRNA interferase family)
MPPLPAVTPSQVVKALEKLGFYQRRQHGSHLVMVRDGFHGRPVVPMHNGDIKKGTLRSIIRQAGITVEEFVALL